MICAAPWKTRNTILLGKNLACEAPKPKVVLMDRRHPHRQQAEKLVQSIFFDTYGARLSTFYPYLLAIHDDEGTYQAVVGLRSGLRPLFCEHYLPEKAETLLKAPRSTLVEIGNLATLGAGHIRWIITALTAFLEGAGFVHVLFTITPLLRNSFVRMGLPLTYLASADAQCLPSGLAREWGAYYDCNPQVYAGYIPVGYTALAAAVPPNTVLESIWNDAFIAGQKAVPLIRRDSQ